MERIALLRAFGRHEMRSLKDTIEYLTDRVNELKLENNQLADELQEAMETIMDLTDELDYWKSKALEGSQYE